MLQRGHFVPAPSLPPGVTRVLQVIPHPLPAQASVSSPVLCAGKFPLYLLHVRAENHTGMEPDAAQRAGAHMGLPFPFSCLAADLPGTGRRGWAGSCSTDGGVEGRQRAQGGGRDSGVGAAGRGARGQRQWVVAPGAKQG